ncbi:MAG: hypothetical protein RMZ43_027890 [Nostoc sp. CmiVER01]|nr:hypothetical protein [Nostoc sp. CmiVER01]MDZ8124000.1 hypothetical protein [Nostoc sp. CmiVER01]
MLRQRLKEANKPENNKNNKAGEDKFIFPLFFGLLFQKKRKFRDFSIYRLKEIQQINYPILWSEPKSTPSLYGDRVATPQ